MNLVPPSLAACYLYSAFREANPLFVQAARMLRAHAEPTQLGNLCWLTYVLLKFGEPPASTPALPGRPCSGCYRHNGILAPAARAAQCLALSGDATGLLILCYGRAHLSGLKISQTYFGGADALLPTLWR